ncbi:hypothetical protein HDU87_006043 [Geranomyces variabilis]|uniref:SRA1/Sec31 domain-containing protein n=1 Tax=Geranomyces variabilis TaxID=109894 RepID=A0AAD5XQP5_9FUNG|nr:hypothetical protein HDU87_006043 [Geranomyces variabilis]
MAPTPIASQPPIFAGAARSDQSPATNAAPNSLAASPSLAAPAALSAPPNISHSSSPAPTTQPQEQQQPQLPPFAPPPFSGYGTPPPGTGYGTPPPLFPPPGDPSQSRPPQQYSAYPEHLRSAAPPPNGTYQGAVAGLNGWNDIPSDLLTGLSRKKAGGGSSSHASGTSTPSGSLAGPAVGGAVAGGGGGGTDVLQTHPDPKGLVASTLRAEMDRAMASANPSQKRMLDDTSKRLENLYERLNADLIPPHVLALAVQLATAIGARDFASATAATTTLMTTSFDQEGKWVLGVKRLVEMAQRV